MPQLALAVLLLGACAANRTHAPATAPPSAAGRAAPATTAAPGSRTAVILAINDVYRIEGVERGTVGGIARVRTLRQQLEREHPDLLVLHAGDLLFPSFLSRTFNGEQMVDVLNGLDGDETAFDPRMFVVFGNHEFELGFLNQAGVLDQRVEQSQFRWVNGNVTFVNGPDGAPVIAAPNLAPSWIVESGGIRVGIFGLTLDSKKPEYASNFADPVETARRLTAELRGRGAEVVVGLTHLNARDDRALLATLGPDGPDLIVGGHDHDHMACDSGGRLVLKADADARTATVIELTLAADGKLTVNHRLEPIDGKLAEDCALAGRVDSWLSLHEGLFCGQQAAQTSTPLVPRCLEQQLGSSTTPLIAEESKIRGEETNLGDWIADRMVESFSSCGAQVAFVNSGSLRLNQDIPAGPITRRTIEELFAYPAPAYLLRLKGSQLQQVAAHAIDYWPGAGNWLQVAGFTYQHDTTNAKTSDVEIVTPSGRRPVRPDEEVLAVTLQYLFDPSGDRDGYTMLDPSLVVKDCAVNGRDLKSQIVIPALQAAADGIAPQANGRIRQVPPAGETDPCNAPPEQ
ncbi:MAG TPA: bifunctional metallophosphatase/5'-nucleotidase [Thermoanaerobaculia bacterium]|jgi:2',3'-cyclic-nucleotide 2'-phosphodiesterase (5'-nucleotidase family)|nr:bifunctional metallophosphatase/5'-nucleotidase [Thermoanaerobaculia bacterium]